MDSVREMAGGRRIMIEMDANAVSPLWFGKGVGGSREREMRSRLLEEWIVVNGMC